VKHGVFKAHNEELTRGYNLKKAKDKVVEKSIGIFDSGIGGLTVVKEIIKSLPSENTIYLGDTARVPYGTKSAQTITRYALEDAHFLMDKGIKLLVIACNTAASVGYSFLKYKLDIPIVEVIGPGAKKAAASTSQGKVGVIGTEATIRSGAYTAKIKSFNPGIEIVNKPCPLFVPLAEETWDEGKDESYLSQLKALAAERYLTEFKEKGIDTLVLGCTHYPLLKNTIDAFIGDKVTLVDSAEETAKEVLRVIDEMNLNNPSDIKGEHKYFVTDAPDHFAKLGTRFLGSKLEEVQQVEVKSL
jgi:glutamate racemase